MKTRILVSLAIVLTALVSDVSARTYSTNFVLNEDPILEGGNWVNGKSVGVDWANVATQSGLAYGRQSGLIKYDDSTALLTGSWGPAQTAQATVHSVNQSGTIFEEVELRLRSSMSAHSLTGYEINFRCLKTAAAYAQIVRWNGPLGGFTVLGSSFGAQFGVTNGDVVKATIVGNVITGYINNVQVVQAIDNTYTTGSPGMGFYLEGTTVTSKQLDYGFTTFTASDGLSPPTKPRTFVSSFGNDANDCSDATPCRSFNSAIALTDNGGEVVVLDSAAYGTASITKPLAIVAPEGVYAGITVSSGTGIVVSPGSGKVTLRGLTLNGLGGAIGVDYQSGDALYIDRLAIRGFGSSGIKAAPGTASAIFAQDTTLTDNAIGAVFAPPVGATGPLKVSLERVSFQGNTMGVSFSGNNVAAAMRSIDIVGGSTGISVQPGVASAAISVDIWSSGIAGASVAAIQAGNGAAGSTATVNLIRSHLITSGTGLSVGAGGSAFVTDTTITKNTTGIALSGGGTAVSSGDNRLLNNVSNGSFSSTVSKK